MKAVFVNWTKPFSERKRLINPAFKIINKITSDKYTIVDYELLYTIMSVGYWKEYNGPTKLYTDSTGYEYYRKHNMLELWDEIDIDTLNNYNNIDAGQFWTSGKTFCICKEEPPFCFLDLDFIIKEKLPEWVFNSDITIAHWEIARGQYYPNKEQFSEIKHWSPPEDYSYHMLVPNTSFLYINNKSIHTEYLKDHLEAVNTKDQIPEWFWLLTDQGLLGQILRRNNIKPQTLTDKVFLSNFEGTGDDKVGESAIFYYPIKHDATKDLINWWHVWLWKAYYNKSEDLRVEHCKKMYQEISINFPKYSHLLKHPKLKQYGRN